MSTTDDPYDDLLDRVRRLSYVRDARRLLGWDQQVTMPDGGAPARAEQAGALSGVAHDLLTERRGGRPALRMGEG